MSDTDAAREMLRDAFTRLIEHVNELTEGLTDEVSTYRPAPDANTIAWLIWHSARVQNLQLADVAGVEEVWTRDGWVDRFGLDLPRRDTGYKHSAGTSPRCACRPTCWPATTTRCTSSPATTSPR